MTNASPIAFLGLGLLGANFTRALVKHGHTVHVWNRSADKARALAAEHPGVERREDPRRARRESRGSG